MFRRKKTTPEEAYRFARSTGESFAWDVLGGVDFAEAWEEEDERDELYGARAKFRGVLRNLDSTQIGRIWMPRDKLDYLSHPS